MSTFERVRRPEYTGRNRCWPCTITNAALLAVLGVVAAVVWLPLAVAVLVAGGVGIWLRGYLVPYTPRVAPPLFDRLPVPSPKSYEQAARGSLAGTGDEAAPDGEAVLDALLDAGVVDADADALALDSSFRDAWADERRALRDEDGEALAAAIESTAPEGVTARAQGSDGSLILVEGSDGGVTLARPIAIAEAAAVRALETTAPELSAAVRVSAARPLRGFLERCPVCGTDVVETTPRSCCGTTNPREEDDRILACPSCDRRIYTFPS